MLFVCSCFFRQHRRPAERNGRGPAYPKARFTGKPQDLLKTAMRNVDLGLGNKERARVRKDGINLLEKFPDVLDLVRHPEREDKVHALRDPDVALLGALKADAAGHAGLFRAPVQDIEHLLLNVHGDDGARIAHHLRHGDRKIPHAAADVRRRHPVPEIGSEHLLRLVKDAAKRVVERIRQPPRADVVLP